MTCIYFNIHQDAQYKTHSPPGLFVWLIFPSLSPSWVLMQPQNFRSTEEWAVGQLYFCRPCTCFGHGAKGARSGEKVCLLCPSTPEIGNSRGAERGPPTSPYPHYPPTSHQLLCSHLGCLSLDFFQRTFLPFSHLSHFNLSLLSL